MIKEILEAQKAFDLECWEKKNGGERPTGAQIITAFFAEVGELVQELKPEWCYWKNTKKTVDMEKVLEELADCLHFAASIAWQGIEERRESYEDHSEAIELVLSIDSLVAKKVGSSSKKYDDGTARSIEALILTTCNALKAEEESSKAAIMATLFYFGAAIGFEHKQLADAYWKKLAVNKERLAGDY